MIQLSDFYGYSMYTISSDTLSVSVMSLGATVTRLVYQGRNVVVSLKTPDDYLQDTSYLGAIVGRYANRIAGGRFPLNGKTVQVEQNEGRNHLHGGSVGFHKRIWAGWMPWGAGRSLHAAHAGRRRGLSRRADDARHLSRGGQPAVPRF